MRVTPEALLAIIGEKEVTIRGLEQQLAQARARIEELEQQEKGDGEASQ